jgi:hypothetical protein
MKKMWFVVMVLLVFVNCETPKPQKVFTGDKQFRTTDPSRLRFLNVRAAYYYRERPQHTKLDIYKLRKFSNGKNKPVIAPVIVNNWMKDEAYLFFENNLYPYFRDTITIKWIEKNDSITNSGFHELTLKTKKNQYEFGGKLYESIQKGHDLFLKNTKNELVPIYNNGEERSAFTMTIRDYYRLTEVY